jgi:hypothetical protein
MPAEFTLQVCRFKRSDRAGCDVIGSHGAFIGGCTGYCPEMARLSLFMAQTGCFRKQNAIFMVWFLPFRLFCAAGGCGLPALLIMAK